MSKAKLVVTWSEPDNGLVLNGPLIIDVDLDSIDDVLGEFGEFHPDVLAGLLTSGLSSLPEELEDGEYEYETASSETGIETASLYAGTDNVHFVLIPGTMLR